MEINKQSKTAIPGIYDLLPDKGYHNGFEVLNMGGSEKHSTRTAFFTYGNPSARPLWRLAQWETRYDFRDATKTTFSAPRTGVYSYDSGDKVFTVDTAEETLRMELRASRVYTGPRCPGQGWPHLQIEGATTNANAPFASLLSHARHLRLSFSQRLCNFRDHMGDGADPTLHAGSFYIYLYIKGIKPNGETEMTWFGLTLFDNRFDFDEEKGSRDGGKADASGLFIYQIPICAFRDQPVTMGQWIPVDIDVLPFVKRALILAQQRGYMQGITMDTLFIDGMNMGWEMPGTYDGCMEIRGLRLRSYVEMTYTAPYGVGNYLIGQMFPVTQLPLDEKRQLQIWKPGNHDEDVLTVRCDPENCDDCKIQMWINGRPAPHVTQTAVTEAANQEENG